MRVQVEDHEPIAAHKVLLTDTTIVVHALGGDVHRFALGELAKITPENAPEGAER